MIQRRASTTNTVANTTAGMSWAARSLGLPSNPAKRLGPRPTAVVLGGNAGGCRKPMMVESTAPTTRPSITSLTCSGLPIVVATTISAPAAINHQRSSCHAISASWAQSEDRQSQAISRDSAPTSQRWPGRT